MIQKKDKLSVNYAVKENKFNKTEVDNSCRTVDLIANTYNYFDSDYDVLIMGCAAKSIQDRGVNSASPGKIKHLMHHDMQKVIAKPTLLEEVKLNDMEVLHANSFFPEVEDSDNELQKYKAGLYDQHSIGFRYMNGEWIEKGAENWVKYLNMLINPQDAENAGFMYIVKEIMFYEYSTVAFGANRLTDFLGTKSENKQVQYQNLITKLDDLHNMMRDTKDKHAVELQERQLKQMIYELYNPEPSSKVTPPEPIKEDTQEFDIKDYLNTHKILK